MAAIDDLRTCIGALIGRAPTDAELVRLSLAFREDWPAETNAGRAQGTLIGIRKMIKAKVRAYAESQVYSAVIRQPHKAADQPALLEAVRSEAEAAGDAAEADV